MEPKSYFKWTVAAAIAVMTVIVLAVVWPFTTVDQSERAIVKNFGNIVRELEPGIHWVTPFTETVEKVNILLQKEQIEADSSSKDLQAVQTTVAITYNVLPDKVRDLVATVGVSNYKSVLIDPAIQDAVKAATAKYTAEELITKRQQVKEDIHKEVIAQINSPLIKIGEIAIVNFAFSPSFNQSIEQKVKAEQDALTQKNKLAQVEYEAQQKIATAEAEAKSIRLKSDAANNEKYVALQALEVQLEFAKHWNGQYPSTYIVGGGNGTNMPLIIPIPGVR